MATMTEAETADGARNAADQRPKAMAATGQVSKSMRIK